MNKEITQKIFEDFPDLYRERSDPRSPLRFGFACMDGWKNLIYELSEKLSKLDPECVVLQVKEKFGGLRFYAFSETDGVQSLINEYESKSYKTCERCGITEGVKKRGGNWLHTFCDNCDIEFNKEKEERWK